ncbi:MAG: alpha/beta fold hydrolase [Deltaproteobacteria bacterium]|nr:alpha/beta fold hydrolase [Deltaproteobacteria bacterium]
MPEQERRLAAIMFTDIEGYTARMGEDEARAIAAVQRSRTEQRRLVEQYHGRWVQEVGDGALCTFVSTVDAVNCALEIQRVFESDPDTDLRIGIHEGDIVMQGDDVFGDGVNIAARIQSLAAAGGICVSGKVYDEIRNKPELHAFPLGEQSLKNVDHLVAVYSVESGAAVPKKGRKRWRIPIGIAAAAVLVAGVFAADGDRRSALIAGIVLEIPRWVGDPIEQELGFVTTPDGVRIAYATTGSGPPVVQVLGWMTHLEEGISSPQYDVGDSLRAMSEDHLFVRYDGRGSGLSDRGVADISLDARVRDLEAVVDALDLDRFAIYAISAGGPTAITYASRHPDRVTRMVFYGSLARSLGGEERRKQFEAIAAVMRSGWGVETHAFRNLFTHLLAPDADDVEVRVISEFLRIANDGDDAANMLESLFETDASAEARGLSLPVLVLHRRGDQLVPLDIGGRDIAALIPGAELIVLDGNDHGPGSDAAASRTITDPTVEFFAADLDGATVASP